MGQSHSMERARAVGSYSAELKPKPIPSKYENEYHPRCSITEKDMKLPGGSRLERIDSEEWRGIGLLRVEFKNNKKSQFGTAAVIADGSCLLTCAHNVVTYSTLRKKFVFPIHAWFELRKNAKLPALGSSVIKRYHVTKIAIYPEYINKWQDNSNNMMSNSGYDLALCWVTQEFSDTDLYQSANLVSVQQKFHNSVSIVGFPFNHNGEKWGMKGLVPESKKAEWTFKPTDSREVLEYDFIDTSPGQSGSPLMGSSGIIGVHAGGVECENNHNYGTYITHDKLKWIATSLGKDWKAEFDHPNDPCVTWTLRPAGIEDYDRCCIS